MPSGAARFGHKDREETRRIEAFLFFHAESIREVVGVVEAVRQSERGILFVCLWPRTAHSYNYTTHHTNSQFHTPTDLLLYGYCLVKKGVRWNYIAASFSSKMLEQSLTKMAIKRFQEEKKRRGGELLS